MFQTVRLALFSVGLLVLAGNATAQSNYQVVSLRNAATITGTVKWSGPLPASLVFLSTKTRRFAIPSPTRLETLSA